MSHFGGSLLKKYENACHQIQRYNLIYDKPDDFSIYKNKFDNCDKLDTSNPNIKCADKTFKLTCENGKILKYLLRMELEAHKFAIDKHNYAKKNKCDDKYAEKYLHSCDKIQKWEPKKEDYLKFLKKESNILKFNHDAIKNFITGVKDNLQKLSNKLKQCDFIDTIDIYAIVKAYMEIINTEQSPPINVENFIKQIKKRKSSVSGLAHKTSKLGEKLKNFITSKKSIEVAALATGATTCQLLDKTADVIKDKMISKIEEEFSNSSVISAVIGAIDMSSPQFAAIRIAVIITAVALYETYKFYDTENKYGPDTISKDEFINCITIFCDPSKQLDTDNTSVMGLFYKEINSYKGDLNTMCIDLSKKCEGENKKETKEIETRKKIIKGMFKRLEPMFSQIRESIDIGTVCLDENLDKLPNIETIKNLFSSEFNASDVNCYENKEDLYCETDIKVDENSYFRTSDVYKFNKKENKFQKDSTATLL